MNILLVIADQLSALALRSYGNTFSTTPNLDRVLVQGTRFSRAYCAYPLCMPARASFWTGRHNHRTGVTSNGRHLATPRIAPEVPTLGSLFTKAGWNCIHVGKCHDSGSLRGFASIPEGECIVPAEPGLPLHADTFRDVVTTERAVEVLGELGRDPWFLAVDLNNPHDICGWVGKNAGTHEDVPIAGDLPPLPANFADQDIGTRPKPVQYACCAHRRLSQAGPWTESNYRHYLAAYHHYVGRLDRDVGRILDALDKRTDVVDTLVVFMADHGDALAAHGHVTKHTSFYEEPMRIPFAMRGPGLRSGAVVDALASQLDLLPTLCRLADIPVPMGLDGLDLSPWLRGDQGPRRDHLIAEWYSEWGFTIEPGRMVRSERFKYTSYREAEGEELFDLETDPGETRNLVGDPAMSGTLAYHRRLLAEHCTATNDPYATLAWRAEPRWRSHPPGCRNHVTGCAPDEVRPSWPELTSGGR